MSNPTGATQPMPTGGPAPFPGNPGRTIRLDSVPFGKLVVRSVFRPEEVAWQDTEYQRVKARPELWVPSLMAHLEAHRTLSLSIGKLARGSVGAFGIRRGYPLRADFLSRWNVFETLWRLYITADAKPLLAAQLEAHPYEAEVLRTSKYFGSAISGMQVEFAKVSLAAQSEMIKDCPYCAEPIKAKAVICRFCNRELPA
jgi:hypothetical protein